MKKKYLFGNFFFIIHNVISYHTYPLHPPPTTPSPTTPLPTTPSPTTPSPTTPLPTTPLPTIPLPTTPSPTPPPLQLIYQNNESLIESLNFSLNESSLPKLENHFQKKQINPTILYIILFLCLCSIFTIISCIFKIPYLEIILKKNKIHVQEVKFS